MEIRSESESLAWLFGSFVTRRRIVDGFQSRGWRALQAADLRRDHRRAADRSGWNERKAVRRLRNGWLRGADSRGWIRAGLSRRLSGDVRATGLGRPGDYGIIDRRQRRGGYAARSGAWLRRTHRRAPLDLGPDSLGREAD